MERKRGERREGRRGREKGGGGMERDEEKSRERIEG